jgi:hypothetical protein
MTLGQEHLALARRSREELFNWIETTLLVAGSSPEERAEAGIGALLDWVAAEPVGARALLLVPPEPIQGVLELQREAFADGIELLRRTMPPDPTRPSCVEDVVAGALVSILRTLVVAGEHSRAPELRDGIARFVLFSFAREACS